MLGNQEETQRLKTVVLSLDKTTEKYVLPRGPKVFSSPQREHTVMSGLLLDQTIEPEQHFEVIKK